MSEWSLSSVNRLLRPLPSINEVSERLPAIDPPSPDPPECALRFRTRSGFEERFRPGIRFDKRLPELSTLPRLLEASLLPRRSSTARLVRSLTLPTAASIEARKPPAPSEESLSSAKALALASDWLDAFPGPLLRRSLDNAPRGEGVF